MREKKDTITIEEMFEGNTKNVSEIKDIIDIHMTCIKKIIENHKILEEKVDLLYKLVVSKGDIKE